MRFQLSFVLGTFLGFILFHCDAITCQVTGDLLISENRRYFVTDLRIFAISFFSPLIKELGWEWDETNGICDPGGIEFDLAKPHGAQGHAGCLY